MGIANLSFLLTILTGARTKVAEGVVGWWVLGEGSWHFVEGDVVSVISLVIGWLMIVLTLKFGEDFICFTLILFGFIRLDARDLDRGRL